MSEAPERAWSLQGNEVDPRRNAARARLGTSECGAGRRALGAIVVGLAVLLAAASPSPAVACTYALYSYSAVLFASGGAGATRVWTDDAGCEWTAVSNDPAWIAITAGGSGAGNAYVEFTVAANDGPARIGSISVAGFTYFVYQYGIVCSISLSADGAESPAAGGSGSVGVLTTGSSCEWAASSSDPSWLTITAGGSGTGEGTVEYAVAANDGEARWGTLAIAGSTFTVSQEAAACTFALEPTAAAVPHSGGAGSFTVTTNLASCSWSATSTDASWLTITSGEDGVGSGTVAWTAAANDGDARAASITVGGMVLVVEQEVAPCTYSLSATHISVPASGELKSLEVRTNVTTCAWTAASNDPDWLSVAEGGAGEGSGKVVVEALPGGGEARHGTLVIAGQIVDVTQVDNPYDLVIPAAANTSGVGTSRWQTDLDFLNTGAADATVELSLLLANQANPTPATRTVSVPPGTTVRQANVLGSLFSAGNAALGVRFLVGEADVNARFYNTASACGGTYGMMVPAAAVVEAAFDGDPVLFHLLTHSSDPTVGFRVNVGFANATAAEAVVEVELHDGDGAPLKTVTQTLAGFEHRQITTIFRQPPATTSVSAGWARVRVTTQGGMVYSYAMVIDNVSGDPVYVRPVRGIPAPVADGFDIALSAAANTPGNNGTQWQTDVDLFNPGGEAATVRLELLRANQANEAPQFAEFEVPAGQTLRLDNLLGSVFSAGNAAIGVEMLSGWASVTSRFYNTASACGGTFGMLVPGETDAPAIAFGQVGYFHHLSFSRDGSVGHRVNIGFMNDTALATDVAVRLYGDEGELLKTVEYTLQPFEHRQFTRIHREPAPVTDSVAHGHAAVTVATSGGRVHAYAMLIDNVSGDPVFIQPTVDADSVGLSRVRRKLETSAPE